MKDHFDKNREEMTPAERLAVWERLRDEVRGTEPVPAPRRRLESGWMRWVGSAAAACVAAGLLVAVVLKEGPNTGGTFIGSRTQRALKQDRSVDLAAPPGAAPDRGLIGSGRNAPMQGEPDRAGELPTATDQSNELAGRLGERVPGGSASGAARESEPAIDPRLRTLGSTDDQASRDASKLEKKNEEQPVVAELSKEKGQSAGQPTDGAPSQTKIANETPPAAPGEPGTTASVTSPVTAPRQSAGGEMPEREEADKLAAATEAVGAAPSAEESRAKDSKSSSWGNVQGLYQDSAPSVRADSAPQDALKHRAINQPSDLETSTSEKRPGTKLPAPALGKVSAQPFAPLDTSLFTVTQIPDSLRVGIIEGTVVDARTKAPIPYSTVSVAGTTRGSFTDEEGAFRLGPLNPGADTLKIYCIGYVPASVPLQIEIGHRVRLIMMLRAAPPDPSRSIDFEGSLSPAGVDSIDSVLPR